MDTDGWWNPQSLSRLAFWTVLSRKPISCSKNRTIILPSDDLLHLLAIVFFCFGDTYFVVFDVRVCFLYLEVAIGWSELFGVPESGIGKSPFLS
jgi:hypothetical protein